MAILCWDDSVLLNYLFGAVTLTKNANAKSMKRYAKKEQSQRKGYKKFFKNVKLLKKAETQSYFF